MILTDIEIRKIAENLPNYFYSENLEATEELITLFDGILNNSLTSWNDYVLTYDSSFYTYKTFDDLVKSEEEQSDGLTEEECKEQLNKSIWQLPCGWYVQYV